MISISLPFPPMSWFLMAKNSALDGKVAIDLKHRYEKMSYRNRYYVASAQGLQMLSIPIKNGRNQRVPMEEIKIDYSENWQRLHWRTLETNYKRAPFFEYLSPYFEVLFQQQYEYLHQFNTASLQTIQKLIKLPKEILFVGDEEVSIDGLIDIRSTLKPRKIVGDVILNSYYQVFEDKNGFIEDLSIIDYLFNEGIHL
jgi:hypothetical protein